MRIDAREDTAVPCLKVPREVTFASPKVSRIIPELKSLCSPGNLSSSPSSSSSFPFLFFFFFFLNAFEISTRRAEFNSKQFLSRRGGDKLARMKPKRQLEPPDSWLRHANKSVEHFEGFLAPSEPLRAAYLQISLFVISRIAQPARNSTKQLLTDMTQRSLIGFANRSAIATRPPVLLSRTPHF